jgi:hypothetical protein
LRRLDPAAYDDGDKSSEEAAEVWEDGMVRAKCRSAIKLAGGAVAAVSIGVAGPNPQTSVQPE